MRCAIYTRKSTEEGLDQTFNSLDAQREAAEAYVASQRAGRWTLIERRYDDGGFSGASLERPALKRLVADIEARHVDCVVVYKVDRLSRSLLDFARPISIFDRHGTSFVSVTQEFNTTTSMGRLTLNILLSFAQFEREIIAERTRDKLRAARKKGKWIGGIPMLGYDVDPRGGRLVVNEPEAEWVREIFAIAAQAGSLEAALRDVHARGLTTKDWTSRRGTHHPGRTFSKSTLRRLLDSILYIGSIRHRGTVYAGEQPPIVEEKLWRAVNEQLELSSRHQRDLKHHGQDALLGGLLYCGQCGGPMKPTFTRQRKYRYYSCDCAAPPVAVVDLEPELLRQLEPIIGHTADARDLGHLPQTRGQPDLVLHLEKAVCGDGRAGTARAAATAGREQSAEATGGGSGAGSADPAGDRLKKALKPRQRCRLARWAQEVYQIGARRSARLVKVPWTTLLYKSRKKPQEALRRRLREVASTHVRYGYRRLTVPLRREGWHVNAKRIYRLYREEELIVRTKQRRKMARRRPVPTGIAARPNQCWSMDFVSDKLADGRSFRILTVVDQFTRECVGLEADRSMTEMKVAQALEGARQERSSLPKSITVDNGSEFCSRALETWAMTNDVQLCFICPARPVENGFIESFNGRLRDECLNVEWFTSLDDAQGKLAKFRQH